MQGIRKSLNKKGENHIPTVFFVLIIVAIVAVLFFFAIRMVSINNKKQTVRDAADAYVTTASINYYKYIKQSSDTMDELNPNSFTNFLVDHYGYTLEGTRLNQYKVDRDGNPYVAYSMDVPSVEYRHEEDKVDSISVKTQVYSTIPILGNTEVSVTPINIVAELNYLQQNAEDVRSISELEITRAPDRTQYAEGESFDATGMIVSMRYSDGTSSPITGYEIVNGENLTASAEVVTITYKDAKPCTVPITISPVLTSLEIVTPPTKTEYEAGDEFNAAGMVVEAVYADGTRKAVTDYTITPQTLNTGTTSVAIKYGSKVATQEVTTIRKLSNISVVTEPDKIEYFHGEKFDRTGIKVMAFYADGGKADVTDECVYTPEVLRAGTSSVTIKYGNKTTTQAVDVFRKLEGIKITKAPNKTEYRSSEKFDTSGMVVMAYYNDDPTKGVDVEGYTCNPTKLTTDNSDVTVTYTENGITMTDSIHVTVNATLKSIQITRYPSKTEYEYGASFDPTNMEVTAIYDDGGSRIIDLKDGDIQTSDGNGIGQTIQNGYTCSPMEFVDVTSGSVPVTVSYTEGDVTCSATVDVTVKVALLNLTIEQAPYRTTYREGEFFSSKGAKVVAHYSNGKSKEVTDFVCSPGDNVPLMSTDTVATFLYTENIGGVGETVRAEQAIQVIVPDHLEIETPPTKTEYYQGETFDRTGMEVIAVYNDGTSDVIGDYMIENEDSPLEYGQDAVTIVCGSLQCVQEIVVKSPITGIRIDTPPTKAEYYDGENFDPTGAVVIAEYQDGTEVDITEDVTWDKGKLTCSDTEVTATYHTVEGEKTVEQAITVHPVLEGIEITTEPNKTEYTHGDFFDPTGATVTAHYSNGEDVDVTDTIIWDKDKLTYQDTKVTASYFDMSIDGSWIEKNTELNITVKSIVERITITTPPSKVDYMSGDTFNPAGVVVTGTWVDGRTSDVTADVTWDADVLEFGDTYVTAKYTPTQNGEVVDMSSTIEEGKENPFIVKQPITVDHRLESITVTTPPTRLEYMHGDTFDSKGAVVIAHWDDGLESEVTNEVTWSKGKLVFGDNKVTASYSHHGEASADVAITVERELDFIAINTPPTKRTYKHGEMFDPTGASVMALWTDGSTTDITSDAVWSKGKLSYGDTSVMVSYSCGGHTATEYQGITVDKVLDHIAIKVPPLKTNYKQWDTFDPSGVIVEAYWTHTNTPTDVTSSVKWDKTTLVYSDTAATAQYTYAGVTKLAVQPIEVERVLTDIVVSTQPKKVTYNHGDSFDPTGAVVTAKWADGGTTDITSSVTWSKGKLAYGDTYVTASYTSGGVTKTSAKVNVTVDRVLSSIAVTSQPTKLAYHGGEAFDPTGIVVTATWTDGGKTTVNNWDLQYKPSVVNAVDWGYQVEHPDAEPLTTTITVEYSYNGVKKTAPIENVYAYLTLKGLEISKSPDKVNYINGEEFESDGAVIKAVWDDGSKIDVTKYVRWSSGRVRLGDTSVTAKYTYGGVEEQVSVPITVSRAQPPVLMPYDTWYQSLAEKSTITQITFVDDIENCSIYAGSEVIDTWIADEEETGSITCYILRPNGSEEKVLVVAGNTAATILANAQSDSMFYGFENVRSIDFGCLDTRNATSMEAMFYDCQSLEYVDMTELNTSNVTNMADMFANCASLNSVDMHGLDTRKVTTTAGMFAYCSNVTRINLDDINTESVTDMSSMFDHCENLTELNVSGFDTHNVENMSCMFTCCFKLMALELSNFDTSNVTDMSGMFDNCSSLTSIDLSSFDTSSVTRMSRMFEYCSNLQTIFASGTWTTAAVEDGASMFYDAAKLTAPYHKWDGEKVSSTYARLDRVSTIGYFTDKNSYILNAIEVTTKPSRTSYTEGDQFDPTGAVITAVWADGCRTNVTSGVTWDKGKLTFTDTSVTVSYTANGTTKTANVAITVQATPGTLIKGSGWYSGPSTAKATIERINIVDSYTPGSSVTAQWNADVDKAGKIKCYIEGTTLTIAGNGTGSIIANQNSSNMFLGFTAVTKIQGLNVLDTSNVTDMSGMFNNCPSLTSVDAGDLDTSCVTSMSNMFANCAQLDVSNCIKNFNTSNVKDMSFMFYNCQGMTSIDLSNFDTANVTKMQGLFEECVNLRSITWGSKFTTENAVNLGRMFASCSALSNLDVSSFNTSHAQDMYGMFKSCRSLRVLDLSNFDTRHVENIGDMFNGCISLTTIYAGRNWSTACVIESTSTFESTPALAAPYHSWSSDKISGEYARFDRATAIGYLTEKDRALLSIAVTTAPTKTTYNDGETFDAAGMVVTATFSDGSTENVTALSNWNTGKVAYSENPSVAISFTYRGITKNTAQPITVNRVLSSIAITTPATKTQYKHGDSFNAAGAVVTATWQDGGTSNVTSSATWSKGVLSYGDTSVTASYTYGGVTKTATQTVSVDRVLKNIAVTTNSTKVTYNHGDSFDPAGAVVTALWEDGGTTNVTASVTWDRGKLSWNDYSVTASYTYGGVTKTTVQEITVNRVLSGITIATPPTKTAYKHGETFSSSGTTATASWTDGGTTTVTAAYLTWSKGTVAYGDTSVTASYTAGGITKSATVPITVSRVLSKIAITTAPSKTTYTHGDSFSSSGAVVTATWADGGTSNVTSSVTWNKGSLAYSDTAVTASYTYDGVTKTATTPVTVNRVLSKISITTAPAKTTYVHGDKFDPTGAVITATWADGGTSNVTSSVTWDKSTLAYRDATITASYTYNGVTRIAKQGITVGHVLSSIAVTTAPTKTTYNHGDSFNPAGAVVTGTWSDGSTTPDVYVTWDKGVLSYTDTSVTATCSAGGITKTATVPITVNRVLSKIAVTTAPTKTTYNHNDAFDKTGAVVTATWTDGGTTNVSSSATWTPTKVSSADWSSTLAWGQNLVKNGRARSTPTGGSLWTVTGSPGKYYQSDLGSYTFYGGDSSATSTMTQTIDISKYMSSGASGVTATINASTGGIDSENDKASVKFDFQNSSGTSLKSYTLGGDTAADRGNTTKVIAHSQSVSIPSGATQVVVKITFTRASGDVNNGYVTNVGLVMLGKNTKATASYTYDGVTKTATTPIRVDRVPKSMAVYQNASTTTYDHGDRFNPTGLIMKVTYTDGTTANTRNFTQDGTKASYSSPTIALNYSENGKSTIGYDYPITVNRVLSSIAITTAPSTTSYKVGASFSKTGMVVTATYTDGGTAKVTGYTTSYDFSSITSSGGTTSQSKTVKVSYTENGTTKTANQSVTVKARQYKNTSGGAVNVRNGAGTTNTTVTHNVTANGIFYRTKADAWTSSGALSSSGGWYYGFSKNCNKCSGTSHYGYTNGGSTSYYTEQ